MAVIADLSRLRRVDCHVHYQPTGFHQPRRDGPPVGMLGNPDSAFRPGWTDLAELRQVMDATRRGYEMVQFPTCVSIDPGVLLDLPSAHAHGGERVRIE